MSKEFQRSYQTKKETKGSDEPLHESSKIQPKVQSTIVSKIQPKLMKGDGKEKISSEETSSGILPDELKQKMEGSFGQDFSNVTIHKDSSSARDINAKAYTQGSEIHFAPGEYNPGSKEGQELIGHELTHVVQQGQGKVGQGEINGKGLEINQNSGLEKEADDAGKRASEGKSVEISGHGTGIQKKDGDDEITYEDYTVKPGDILVTIVKARFPHMEFDMELVMNKVREIATLNGIDQDKIKPGQVLKIPSTAQEKSNDSHMPAKLKYADQEEAAVKSWSEQSGAPVEVIRGDRVKESEYKNKEHYGHQYFILHSTKKDGIQMNEAISHNSKGDDGYYNKEEIAKGDYSKTKSTTINGCESDENLDGFLRGGTPMAFGYFYKIEDLLASQIGPAMLAEANKGDKERMHQYTRAKMLEMKAKGGIPIKYWAGIIDKYKEYSDERYGVANQYDLKDPNPEWTKENSKMIRKESRKNPHIKADRNELAKNIKDTRKLEKKIAKGESTGNLEKEIEALKEEKKVLQKQMLLQAQLKGEDGEKKSAAVQNMLKEGEAVVEIKPIKSGNKTEYTAFISTSGSAIPKLIYLPNKNKGVDKHLKYHANMIQFDMQKESDFEMNYEVVWAKIQAYLDLMKIKKIYYKADGEYSNVNLNTLFHNGKYLIEMLDVQYLYD